MRASSFHRIIRPWQRRTTTVLVLGALALAIAATGAEPTASTPLEASPTPSAGTDWLRSSREGRLETTFETLVASDVLLTESGLTYREVRGPVQGKIGIGHGFIGLDYQPVEFDFLGHPESVRHHRWSGQLDLRVRVAPRWTLVAGGALYDGFTDYRSTWLDEYFRQQFAELPGYVEAEPRGESGSAGIRWEYLPTTAFLQLSGTWLRDAIAPGYEIDFDGLRRGRPTLYTAAYQLEAENVLTRRIRVLNQFRYSETTGREPRYAYQGSVHWAIGERWVLRGHGGVAFESPEFEAWFGGATLEYALTPALAISVTSRYYRDTGEIENTLFSTAAPGLEALQAGVGLRYTWGRSALRIYGAPYTTRYEPYGLGTAFFAGLYRDRSWGLLQMAYSTEF